MTIFIFIWELYFDIGDGKPYLRIKYRLDFEISISRSFLFLFAQQQIGSMFVLIIIWDLSHGKRPLTKG